MKDELWHIEYITKMLTDQKHLSDITLSEQEIIRYTEKLAWIFGLDKQNAEVYSVLSGENRVLWLLFPT